LKITDVRTAVIRCNFEWILVRVYTDDGIIGLGEAYWGAGVKNIIHNMKDMLLGQNPMNVDVLHQRMMRGTAGSGSIAGATVTAIS